MGLFEAPNIGRYKVSQPSQIGKTWVLADRESRSSVFQNASSPMEK